MLGHMVLNEVQALARLLLEVGDALVNLGTVSLEFRQQLILTVGDLVLLDELVELLLHVHQLIEVCLDVRGSDLLLLLELLRDILCLGLVSSFQLLFK
jgi:MoaA/NifB/PqqE/SkfB family radical SAM enzyme